jgi:23S rRNA (adenine-N6)-dimethyltransferase
VTVLCADARAFPLPLNPFRVVANPPFGATAAILRHLLDDPAGGLVRADLVVQWQVARGRARVDGGPPLDLLGATWAPWWRFGRARRIPAAGFRPAPSVDAAVLTVTRREPALLAAGAFAAYREFVAGAFRGGGAGPTRPVEAWVTAFTRSRRRRPPGLAGLHSPTSSANMG